MITQRMKKRLHHPGIAAFQSGINKRLVSFAMVI